MKKESLLETLADLPIIDITVSQGGLNIGLYLDKENGSSSMSANGITLSYDGKKFEESPEEYISDQLKAHKNWQRLVQGKLDNAHTDLYSDIDEESSVRRIMEFIPENKSHLLIAIAKLIASPWAWIRLKSLQNRIEYIVKNDKFSVDCYKIINIFINRGINFLEQLSEESKKPVEPKVNGGLEECISICKNIGYLYSRLETVAQRKAETSQRFYKVLYPNSHQNNS